MKKQRSIVAKPVPQIVHVGNDTLLKGEEVARILGVGLVTVRRMVSRGQLQSLRLNHSVTRFRQSEVDRYLASLSNKA